MAKGDSIRKTTIFAARHTDITDNCRRVVGDNEHASHDRQQSSNDEVLKCKNAHRLKRRENNISSARNKASSVSNRSVYSRRSRRNSLTMSAIDL
jgi:hypothetical protein